MVEAVVAGVVVMLLPLALLRRLSTRWEWHGTDDRGE